MPQANVIIATCPARQLYISWSAIEWRRVNEQVNNLRKRIYRASVKGDTKQAASLQKLMMRSSANRLSAVRRVTQVNQGRRSPGVDQIIINTDQERVELFNSLSLTKAVIKASPIRRVYIPKKDGKSRPLGLPTIEDRCRQAMVKAALEPYWEAKFERVSYGFRPGRSVQDAVSRVFSNVSPGRSRRWVLKVDIQGAFDNISHDYILKAIGNFPGRAWIKTWLVAGVMERGQLTPTLSGTPQGGNVSPLLLNIALHGMEERLAISYNKWGSINPSSPYALVRYADDSIVFAKTKQECEAAVAILQDWLQGRGLSISTEKSKICSIEEGFDFLGFHIKQHKTKAKRKGIIVLIKPSKESVRTFKKQMKLEWKRSLSWNSKKVIEYLNPKIKGWVSYYKSVASNGTFGKLEKWMWKRQAWYCKRKHPKKSWSWCKHKYWGKIRGRRDRWVFMDKTNGKELYLWKLNWTPIQRHVLVKGRSSPDDPLLAGYWSRRQVQKGRFLFKKRSILWRRQAGLCKGCLEPIDNGEEIEEHHVLPRKLGGKDSIDNLLLLHGTCHKQVHSKYNQQGDLITDGKQAA